MPILPTIRMSDPDAPQAVARLREAVRLDALFRPDRDEVRVVEEVITRVRETGDEALLALTARFDNVEMTADRLRVSEEELADAHRRLDGDLLAAVRKSIEQVRAYQEHVLVRSAGPMKTDRGVFETRYRPLGRVGVCVPGAAAPLPSTVIHSAVPAQVAGVKAVAVIAPPRHNGDIHPVILGVAAELGIRDVYRVGGAQGVAALALGTKTIKRVDKIVGPGSIYTQIAKKLLYGIVDIDSFAGPTEVVIIADAGANPAFLAADLLAQAEHDPGSAILLTPEPDLAAAVEDEVQTQLTKLGRREGAQRSLRDLSALIITADLDQAVELAERFAPEHLEIAADHADELADRIDAAGAIFLGHYTPEAVGDYVAGPSHVLPTGGSARFFSGLSCNDFLRRTSLLRYDRAGLADEVDAVVRLATAEGLDAHARSVTIRTDSDRGDRP